MTALKRKQPLTVGRAEALITDPDTGRYPHRDPFRDELVRALKFGSEFWGADTPWSAIEESDWTALLRKRVDDLLAQGWKARRAAEITVSRLITTVKWLQREKHISRSAAQWPEDWKVRILRYWESVTRTVHDPELTRPLHTVEEAQKIITMADFDPRLQLLMWLGSGLNTGPVARVRRKDLRLPRVDWTTPDDETKDYGTLFVHGGMFKKGRLSVALTAGQRLALDRALGEGGYLHAQEQRFRGGATKNYVLFPSGYAVGRIAFLRGKEARIGLADTVNWNKPLTTSWIRKNFRRAEERADIKHIEGRSSFRLPVVEASRPATAEQMAGVAAADASPDFAPLTSDPDWNAILQRRWVECIRCINARADLAATVMMGGLLEALLVARANQLKDKSPLFKATTTPRDKSGQPLELRQWTLAPYIDVAHELGWINASAKDVAVVLRDYRNYVHPNKEWLHDVRIDDDDSRLFWDVTKNLARQLLDSAVPDATADT